MLLQVAADARQVGHDRDPERAQMRGGPIPDRISSAGEWSAPAETITSRPSMVSRSPVAHHAHAAHGAPSSTRSRTCVSVMTARFGRARVAASR